MGPKASVYWIRTEKLDQCGICTKYIVHICTLLIFQNYFVKNLIIYFQGGEGKSGRRTENWTQKYKCKYLDYISNMLEEAVNVNSDHFLLRFPHKSASHFHRETTIKTDQFLDKILNLLANKRVTLWIWHAFL